MTKLWPGEYKSAFCVTVDLEGDLRIRSENPDLSGMQKTLSTTEYGFRRGIERLAGVFGAADCPATWFVPAATAAGRAAELSPIRELGHPTELYLFGTPGGREEGGSGAGNDLSRDVDLIEQHLGHRPSGARAVGGALHRGFQSRLAGAGLEWSSSWHGDDVPFWSVADGASLVEVPVQYELEDNPFFAFNLIPAFPVGQSRIAHYEEVLDIWRREMHAYRRYGLCYVLRLRPEISGTPGRASLIRELIAEAAGFDDVWVTTVPEVARWWSRNGVSENPSGHPADVFEEHWQTAGAFAGL